MNEIEVFSRLNASCVLTAANMADYLREPSVGGIGGSWLAPRDVIRARDWARIIATVRDQTVGRQK
jgi:2-keto-3-deoxy-6-phosphogluconate aldolase